MILKFAPSALVVALCADGASSKEEVNAALADTVASHNHQKRGSDNTITEIQSKRFLFTSNNYGRSADKRKSELDTGILGGRRGRRNGLLAKMRRHLAGTEGDDVEDACSNRESCEPDLCNCVQDGGQAYDCAFELDRVCDGFVDADGRSFTIDACVSYPEYYYNLYCPFAKCVVDGGSFETCDCEFYQNSCFLYGNDEEFKDDPETIEHCDRDTCCQGKSDNEGRAECLDLTEMPTPSPIGVIGADEPLETVSDNSATDPGNSPNTGNKAGGSAADPPGAVTSDGAPGTSGAAPGAASGAANESAPSTADTSEEGEPFITPPSDTTDDSSEAAPVTAKSSAKTLMSLGVFGYATSFVGATIVWSLLG